MWKWARAWLQKIKGFAKQVIDSYFNTSASSGSPLFFQILDLKSLQAGERSKTAEESEAAELTRLQALERQRQTRMSGDDLGGPDSLEDSLPAGGYARKRAKRQREQEDAKAEGDDSGKDC